MAAAQNWAVLPVKRLDTAKSRLDGVLGPAQRRDLAASLFLHTLRILQACPAVDKVLVVCADAEVLSQASALGAQPVSEAGSGLNQALVQARRHAMTGGAASLLVLASDLPLLRATDIDALYAVHDAAMVIAPDRRRQGTNALLLHPPDVIEFAFGDDSFERHRNLAATSGAQTFEVSLPGLAFDVDLPDDWRDLQVIGWHPDTPSGARERLLAAPGSAAPGSRGPGIRGLHPSA